VNNVVGNSNEIAIALFIKTGPLSPRDGYELVTLLNQKFSSWLTYDVTAHLSPQGVKVILTGPYDDRMKAAIEKLGDTRLLLETLTQNDQIRQPVNAQILMAGLMSHNFDPPFTQVHLHKSPILVLVACGSQAINNPEENTANIQYQIQNRLGSFINKYNDTYPSLSDFEPHRRWIHIPERSGSIVRLYKPLHEANNRTEALSRSLGNAIIGGIGSSTIAQILRDEQQISYNPYSALITQAGLQWLVIEADTTTGFEQELIHKLRELMNTGFDAEFTARNVKSAAQFMIRQRRAAFFDPSSALQLQLAKYDGSDPWHITNASLEEFLDIDIFHIKQVVNKLFVYESMSLIGLSNVQEQKVFSST